MAKELHGIQITEIAIDDLGIDIYNVRKTPWDHNEDLIGSIKTIGIQMPLLVRPADPSTGVKYSIVHGSRRFNAAIDAGLKTVPCRIREMDDLKAAVASFDENFNRNTVPNWQFALQLGTIASFLGGTEKENQIMLKKETGLSDDTIDTYLAVSELPEQVIELLKSPKERTTEAIELLKNFNIDEKKVLSLEKAALISKQLPEVSLAKQLEVAAYVIQVPVKKVSDFIERVQIYPKKGMEEIEKIVTLVPKGKNVSTFFSAHILQSLDEATVKMNRDRNTLIAMFVEEGLEKRGYLR